MGRSLQIIDKHYQLIIDEAIGITTGSIQSLTDQGYASSAAFTTAPGCGRDNSGGARLEFVVSSGNITKEEFGFEARRKLQSTLCSATDGTQVG